jgi:hypothetical protein
LSLLARSWCARGGSMRCGWSARED